MLVLQFLDKEINMNKRIIYPNDNGGLVLVIPAPNCGLTIEQIAAKDVPNGKPYKILEASDVPEDHSFFDAWEADFSTYDGHGEDYGIGSRNAVVGWNNDGSPMLRVGEIIQ
jgi:hypothetical protein